LILLIIQLFKSSVFLRDSYTHELLVACIYSNKLALVDSKLTRDVPDTKKAGYPDYQNSSFFFSFTIINLSIHQVIHLFSFLPVL